jgi:hypothetical protein
MDAKKFEEHPERLSVQYEELITSINKNLRFILEAIKRDRGYVIEEENGNPHARRLRFWFENGRKEF